MAFSTRDGYLGFAAQSGLSAPASAAGSFQFVKSLNGTDLQVETTSDALYGVDGQQIAEVKQYEIARGQLSANLRPDLAGALFQFVPGVATWDGGSAPALHTFAAATAAPRYATLQYQPADADSAMLVADSIFSGLTISGQSGQPLKIDAPLVGLHPMGSVISGAALDPYGVALYGAGLYGGATSLASYSAEPAFLYYHSPSISINGIGDQTIESFQVQTSLDVQELSTNAPTRDAVFVTGRSIELGFTRRYQNSALWRYIWMSGGVSPATSVATGSFGGYWQYGSGASLRSFALDLPLLLYEGDVLTELDPDGKTIRETISARAARGATHPAVISIRNGHASSYG